MQFSSKLTKAVCIVYTTAKMVHVGKTISFLTFCKLFNGHGTFAIWVLTNTPKSIEYRVFH